MSMSGTLANLSIRNKIVCGFLSLIIVIAALGFTSIQKFAMLNNSVEEITTNYLLALGYLGDMRSAILHYRLNLSKAVPGKASGDAIGTAETALAKWTAALEVPEAKYAPTVVTDTEKAIYADYKVVWREYLEAERDTFGLLKAGKFDDAIEHLNRMTANR